MENLTSITQSSVSAAVRALATVSTLALANSTDTAAALSFSNRHLSNWPVECNNPRLDKGTDFEYKLNAACQWVTFCLTIAGLIFYGYQGYKAHVGWEEVYVAILEAAKVGLEVYLEWSNPFTIYQTNGNVVLWIRYWEWLLTCPVILVHLSNMTGLNEEYNSRTLILILTDVGCITFGVTAALSHGPIKVLFFLIAASYGATTFFNAAKVYIETYHTMPKGTCRQLVRIMAWVYFSSWMCFPLFFIAGPEGLGQLSFYGTTIAHTFGDLVSKNLWGLLGHQLRIKVREHILVHGDVRKKNTINVAGNEVEVETFVDEDEEGAEKKDSKYGRRASFVKMADNMKNRGIEVRQSFAADEGLDGQIVLKQIKSGNAKEVKADIPSRPLIETGRVILITPDLSIIDYFKQLFVKLPAMVNLMTTASVEQAMPLMQQAAMSGGGVDCVLLHPELLKDQSPQGSLAKLRMMGQRIIAFGWGTHSPVRELIECSGVDGWLEGPAFGIGIKTDDVVHVLARMQALKKQSAMMGSMGHMGMLGGIPSMLNPMMGGAVTPQLGGSAATTPRGTGNPLYSPTQWAMPGMGASNIAGAAPGSPAQLVSTLQMPMGPGLYRSPSHNNGNNPANSVSEADVLAQLMSEIGRLKSELGEPSRP